MSTRITVTVPDEVDEELPYGDYDSKSETVVEYVKKGFELESAKAERDDLRRQLQAANRHQRDVGELVEYVNEERTLSRKKHQASAAQRIKWLLFGGDESE